MKLKIINSISLVFIVALVLIDLFFGNYIKGAYNTILTALLTVSVVTSVVIEIIIKSKKQNEN